MVVLDSFTQPTERIRHTQPDTTAYFTENNLGKGTLFIAESHLSWIGNSGNGFSVQYPQISLHAVSRDLTAYPQKCLFLMIDTQNQQNEQDCDNEEEQGFAEMRLVPDDERALDAMFQAMSACQALHPDPQPEDDFSDEDFYEDADEEPMEATDSQMANLSIGQNGTSTQNGSSHESELDPGCFDDAEDSPDN